MNLVAQTNLKSVFSVCVNDMDGVVFTKEYDQILDINKVYERITPTVQQLNDAEEILKKSWTIAGFNKRFYAKAKRQYAGYLTETGEAVIVINLFYFKKKARASCALLTGV